MCDQYVRYVRQSYDATAIVFDGYSKDLRTMDACHILRNGGCKSVTIYFTVCMVIQTQKDIFLRNSVNKQWFIHMLSDKLERAGCHTDHARQDAEFFIVQTAIESAKHQPTVLIGGDTYLLVLLLYTPRQKFQDYFFFLSMKKIKFASE